jgi:hypothetical protein
MMNTFSQPFVIKSLKNTLSSNSNCSVERKPVNLAMTNINQDSEKLKSWTQSIVVICFLFSLSLGIYLTLQQHLVDIENKAYSLTFKDDLTAFETTYGTQKITLTAHNNQPYSHQLKFYGLDRSDIAISKTDLSNQDGGIIEHSKIVLTPNKIPDNRTVNLSIKDSKVAGTFNGWLILSDTQVRTSIPLKASTPPLLYIPIGWVVVGAAISIGLWEIVRYLRNKKLESEEGDLKNKLDELSSNLNDSIELVEEIKPIVKEVDNRMNSIGYLLSGSDKFVETSEAMAEQQSRFAPRRKQVEGYLQGLSKNVSNHSIKQALSYASKLAEEAEMSAKIAREAMDMSTNPKKVNEVAVAMNVSVGAAIGDIRERVGEAVISARGNAEMAMELVRPTRKIAEGATQWQSQLRAEAEVNRMTVANVRNKIVAAKKRVADGKQKVRLAIIDIITAGFGVAIALIGVLSDALVTNLQVLGNMEILTLIGIGLGVGSLKEIVDKD